MKSQLPERTETYLVLQVGGCSITVNSHLNQLIGVEKPQPQEQIRGLTEDRAAETLTKIYRFTCMFATTVSEFNDCKGKMKGGIGCELRISSVE